MKRNERGRALFYTRDSGGKAETTPAEYVAWAIRKSEELGTSFDGTARAIEGMIRAGTSVCGDVFLDYDICGNLLSRPGLDAMIKETKNDAAVSLDQLMVVVDSIGDLQVFLERGIAFPDYRVGGVLEGGYGHEHVEHIVLRVDNGGYVLVAPVYQPVRIAGEIEQDRAYRKRGDERQNDGPDRYPELKFFIKNVFFSCQGHN